jgi:hypothetical protein
VIDCYERDYRNLASHSASYPTPEALRAIAKQRLGSPRGLRRSRSGGRPGRHRRQ